MIDNIGLPNGGFNLAFGDNPTLGTGDGEILLSLSPERNVSTAGYQARLRQRLAEKFPGVVFYFEAANITNQILNFGLPSPIDVQIGSKNAAASYALALDLQSKIARIPGAVDVHIHQVVDYPEIRVNVDRNKAGLVGLTQRTSVLFGPPGRAYVYRSYGIHALLNAVCEPVGVGAAVLIRALEPLDGVEEMRARRGVEQVRSLCSGPGKLTQALGIELELNDADLLSGPVIIGDRPRAWRGVQVGVSRRIGITKAAELPWRFCAVGSRFLSKPG